MTSFQISSGFCRIENNRFQQSKTWSSEESRRFMSFHVHLAIKNTSKHQNTESKAGRSGEKSAPFKRSPRVTSCDLWCWYDLIRDWQSLQSWAHCFCVCRLRSLWHCFVDSSWREKEVLEVWRKACLGSFLKVIRWFCVVLFDYC